MGGDPVADDSPAGESVAGESARPALRAVAAYGLPGSCLALPEQPLDAESWTRLRTAVHTNRLAGHLVDAIVRGDFPATDGQAQEAAVDHAAAMATSVKLERLLLDVVDGFEAEGIEPLVLKGPALAHTAYANPAQRVFGDIDLLVRGEDFDTATAALERRGCQRRWPQLRAGFDRRFGKSGTYRTPDGHELDLHRTLVLGPFGLTVDLPGLFARRTAFEVGGRKLATVGADEHFLVACYHAVLGTARPRLVPLRDVAQLLLATDVDSGAVLDLASRWGGRAVVARAVRAAWETFELADALPLTAWAMAYRPSRREASLLSAYQRTHDYGRKALAGVRVVPGLAGKVAYLRALMLPDRSTLTTYTRSYRDWWRRGGRAVLPGRRRHA